MEIWPELAILHDRIAMVTRLRFEKYLPEM